MASSFSSPDSNVQVTLYKPESHPTNAIRTNKYTWLNFLPLNLWEQFSQLGNFYFLVVAGLQCIKSISNTNGQPLTLIPLAFVIGVGMIKDIFEDWKRKQSDENQNNHAAERQEREEHFLIQFKDIRPGMLLRVKEGAPVPADCLLLASATEGHCFVETANLDGEANLKKKDSILKEGEWEPIRRGDVTLQLECEQPTVDLYSFQGFLKLKGEVRGVGINSLLLRGTSVQQTPWVLCMAVYVGHDTRALKNSRSARFKASNVDIILSRIVIKTFACQIMICSVLAMAGAIWATEYREKSWYLGPSASIGFGASIVSFIQRLGAWILNTNTLVPISLIVTLTGVKFIQGIFLGWDDRCGSGGRKAEVHTSQVIESFGQVTHVFSDKTGTLTKNLMEYKACSCAGKIYGLSEQAGPQIQAAHVTFKEQEFLADLSNEDKQEKMGNFLLCHALCHTVEASAGAFSPGPGEDAADVHRAPYSASSPDELALVCMARSVGVEFRKAAEGRSHLKITRKEPLLPLKAACGWTPSSESMLAVDFLALCDFDNDRKRMSVVVRYPNGKIILLVKGADTNVLPLCKRSTSQEIILCERHLLEFATQGLRTLCLAYAELEEERFLNWNALYEEAKAEISEERTRKVQGLAAQLEEESQLTLLGATAIEDRLQDEVPETIQRMRDAGIRVWVLTGDKVETAISIGNSCRLLTEDMDDRVILNTDGGELSEELKVVKLLSSPAMIISGAALATALEDESLRSLLFEAGQRCRTVLACRVSPKQKADVVQLVKSFEASSVTLSIGDGANDVSMIVTAHVGVGLSGKEGAQAAHASDVAISEFRLLSRLLFVHGREGYRRTCIVILYNFYKNMLLVFPTIIAAGWSASSGQGVFSPVLIQVYNVLYTQVPICLYGVTDKAAQDLEQLEKDPKGYAPCSLSGYILFAWAMAAACQAILILSIYPNDFVIRASSGGVELNDIGSSGDIRFIWVVMGVNLTLTQRQNSWFWWTWIAFPFGIVVLMVSLIATSAGAFSSPVTSGARGVFGAVFFTSNFLRFMLHTTCAMCLFLLVGEPFIRHSEKVHASAAGIWEWLFPVDRGVVLDTPVDIEQPARPDATAGSSEASSSHARPLLLEAREERRPSMSSFQGGHGYSFDKECVLEHTRRGSQGQLSFAVGRASLSGPSAAPATFSAHTLPGTEIEMAPSGAKRRSATG